MSNGLSTPFPSHEKPASPQSISIKRVRHCPRGGASIFAREREGLEGLCSALGGARLALIGEASHGTHEFYALRSELTRRLILNHGFRMVVAEADWPDAFRAHRYVTGRSRDRNAEEALGDFQRFPLWMWRNAVVAEFLEWLRKHNSFVRSDNGGGLTGFYGMDLYSMSASIEAVLDYLDSADPEAARLARRRYACFEEFAEDPQYYALATVRQGKEPCEEEVTAQLMELLRRQQQLLAKDGAAGGEEFFSAEQNARLVRNAEAYYRSMAGGRSSSWNLRDRHMMEILERLLEKDPGGTKAVVWAHNSHLGDARATQMGRRGELNVGQLVRERFGDEARLLGLTTFDGTVTAARDWGDPAEHRRVNPAFEGSVESLFHSTGLPEFWLDLRNPELRPPASLEKNFRNGPLGSFTARKASAKATTLTPRPRASSISSRISTAPARCARWTAGRRSPKTCRKLFQVPCD